MVGSLPIWSKMRQQHFYDIVSHPASSLKWLWTHLSEMPFEPHVMEGAGQGLAHDELEKTDRVWLWWVEAYHSQPPRKKHLEIDVVRS